MQSTSEVKYEVQRRSVNLAARVEAVPDPLLPWSERSTIYEEICSTSSISHKVVLVYGKLITGNKIITQSLEV